MPIYFYTYMLIFVGLQNAQFQLIFDHALYYTNGYTINGFIFMTIPLIFTALFYFLYHNPFSKYWHWIIALVLCIVIVGSSTYQYSINLIFTNSHPDLRISSHYTGKLVTPALQGSLSFN